MRYSIVSYEGCTEIWDSKRSGMEHLPYVICECSEENHNADALLILNLLIQRQSERDELSEQLHGLVRESSDG